MSAESQMEALLSNAITSAGLLNESASTLVNNAIGVIQTDVQIPEPPPKIAAQGLFSFDTPQFAPQVSASGTKLPPFPEVDLETPPIVTDIERINLEFAEELADLNLPTFRYSRPGNAPRFHAASPQIDASLNLPTLPDTQAGSKPQVLPFAPLSGDTQLNVEPPKLADIDVEYTFDKNLFDRSLREHASAIFSGIEGLPGLDALLAELAEFGQQALDTVLPALLDTLTERLTDRYAPVAREVETLIRSRLDRRLIEVQQWVQGVVEDTSGWELPAAAQAALQAFVAQHSAAWKAQADSRQETDVLEKAQAFFEFSSGLYAKLREAIQSMKIKEIELLLEAHRQSIVYAKHMVAALLTAFRVEEYETYDLEYKKKEGELIRFESELKVKLLDFEVIKARLEIESAKQQQDGLLIKQYQNDAQQLDTEIRIIAGQVAAAKTELQLKKLPIEIFDAQVRAFNERINARQAEVQGLLAEIEGNDAEIEAQLARVKAFEAQAEGFIAKINAKVSVIEAQEQRNEGVIEEYQALVKGEMGRVESEALRAQYDLAAYGLEADDYIADAKIAMASKELDTRYQAKETDGTQQAYRLTQERILQVAEWELARLKSLADVHATGANVMASMGAGAMTAANGLAGVILEEFS